MKRLVLAASLFALLFNQFTSLAYAAGVIDQQFYSGNDILFYDPTCTSGTATGYITLNGKDNTEKILKFFMDHGLTLAQSSGIVGNFMAESGLDPTIIQGGGHAKPNSGFTPTSGVGFGLAQWTSGGRQQGLVNKSRELGVDITDLGVQLAYAWDELTRSYPQTLIAVKATSTPSDAAVAFHDGYERSADTQAAVVNNRGGNATKVYAQFMDAPALSGSTSSSDNEITELAATTTSGDNLSGACTASGYGDGNLQNMVKQYAWSQYISSPTNKIPEADGRMVSAIDQTPAYASAVNQAIAQGRYVGGTHTRGNDCGGFVTTLMIDSGFDKSYNHSSLIKNGAGYTIIQEQWLRDNWQQISATDAADRQPGDVAINNQHTYVYVGDIPGFGSKIASASVSGPERAPMAGHEGITDPSFRWYRIKTNLNVAK